MLFRSRPEIRSRLDSRKVLVPLGILVFLSVGILLGGLGIHHRLELARSANWTAVPVKIVELGTRSGDDGFVEIRCRYTYVFAGKQYSGTRVRINGQGSQSKEYADLYDRLVRCQQNGEQIGGLVNPNDPRQAVLWRESPRDMNLLIGGGAAFIAGALLFVFLAWKY